MVVGNGMVAKLFKRYETNDDFLIFASGVSNSKSTDTADYLREFNSLKECVENNTAKTLAYFSTTSVNDPAELASSYVMHKLNLERYIELNTKNHIIFRVSNLVGKSPNKNTVLNFFTRHIIEGVHFNLWVNASRNLIGVDDFYNIADYILRDKSHMNKTINIANPSNYPVKKIIETIELFKHRKADYTPVDKGCSYQIEIEEIKPIIKQLGINFGEGYLEALLNKYYSDNEL